MQLLQSMPSGKQANNSGLDIEVVAYCFAAVISMVDISVIQN
jgi:hypothetical protein